MKDDRDIRDRLVFLWDAIGGMSTAPLPHVSNPVVHIERRGPLVIGYIIDGGVVARTVTALTKGAVRRKIAHLTGGQI